MKHLFLILFLITTFLVQQSAWTSDRYFTNQAMSLEIKKEGFDLLSRNANELLADQLTSKEIPDIENSIPLMARYSIKGVSFDAKFDTLKLSPTNNGLDLFVSIKNLTINAKRIRVENYFMPNIGTSCYNTQVVFGNNNSLPIRARLKVFVRNRKIDLRLANFDFHMKRNQYVTRGPQKCYGAFGIRDHFTQIISDGLLTFSRPVVELALKTQLGGIIKKLNKMINQYTTKTFPVTIPNLSILPETKLALGISPYHLTLNPQGMLIKASLYMQRLPLDDKSLDVVDGNSPMLYSTIGVNPEAANQLLSLVLMNGSEYMEIDKNISPDMANILLRDQLAAFWPDMNLIQSDSNEVRMMARLSSPPQLDLSSGLGIDTSIKDAELLVKVKQDGKWIDYYTVLVNIDLKIIPVIKDGKIDLKIIPGEFSLDGKWASSYTPEDNTFNKDQLHFLFSYILKALTETEEPLQMDVPVISLPHDDITLSNLRYDDPYLMLDLVEAQE